MNLNKTQWIRWLNWLAAAGWMVVIFLFSAQVADRSDNTSATVLQWVLDLIFRDFASFSAQRQEMIQRIWTTVIRKGAHFSEYAVLAMLLTNALRFGDLPAKAKCLLPVGISVVYAVTDEVHQFFVPGRACRLLDVGIDTCGAIFGLCLFLVISALVKKRK